MAPVQQPPSLEAPLSPLSSRPERSAVERSAVLSRKCFFDKWGHGRAGPLMLMKNGSCSPTTVGGSAVVAFVISTGAKRSGEICGLSSPDCHSGPQRPSPLSSRRERSAVERSAVFHPWTVNPVHNDPPLCHLDRSEAQWRDLRSFIPGLPLRATTTLPFVISTGAKRSGEICGLSSLDCQSGPQRPSPLSSRPERSAVERSAVFRPRTATPGHNDPPLCHLDRSEAQWRDLRSFIPGLSLRSTTTLPFVISTGAQRSGEICGLSSPDCHSGPQRPSPLSSRPERSAVERSAVFHPWTVNPVHNDPPLCHLDRSEAQWRDLRSFVPGLPLRATTTLPFVISTGAKRSGEICGLSSLDCHSGPQLPSPSSSRPERSVVERSAVVHPWTVAPVNNVPRLRHLDRSSA